jgi:hypothetical protein
MPLSGQCRQFEETPHNTGSRLTGDFQPSAACKFLDLPPDNRDSFRQQATEIHPLMGREHCAIRRRDRDLRRKDYDHVYRDGESAGNLHIEPPVNVDTGIVS